MNEIDNIVLKAVIKNKYRKEGYNQAKKEFIELIDNMEEHIYGVNKYKKYVHLISKEELKKEVEGK